MYLLIATASAQPAILQLYQPADLSLVAEQVQTVDCRLAQTLLADILRLLKSQGQSLESLKGLAVFAGPAAFTDLRASHAVANALAYSLSIPVVNGRGTNWQSRSLQKLQAGGGTQQITPHYGQLPTITQRRK